MEFMKNMSYINVKKKYILCSVVSTPLDKVNIYYIKIYLGEKWLLMTFYFISVLVK